MKLEATRYCYNYIMSAGDSLIEECTSGTTKAGLYLSRLGLEKEIKNPNKPGKPKFSIPELDDLWEATKVKKIRVVSSRTRCHPSAVAWHVEMRLQV